MLCSSYESLQLKHLRDYTFSVCAPEAVIRRCFLKKETKRETLAQVFSCEFLEISKNTVYYRTPLVAAYGAPFSVGLICQSGISVK